MTACTSAPSAGPGDGRSRGDRTAPTASSATLRRSRPARLRRSRLATTVPQRRARGARSPRTAPAPAKTFCEKGLVRPGGAEERPRSVPGTRETGYYQLTSTAFVCGRRRAEDLQVRLQNETPRCGVNVFSQGPCPIARGGAPLHGRCRLRVGNALLQACALLRTDVVGVSRGAARPPGLLCRGRRRRTPACESCDHISYGTACEAAASGTNVDFDGVCAAFQWTMHLSGRLRRLMVTRPSSKLHADIVWGRGGHLHSDPGSLPGDSPAVCGCDGMKYANSCFRSRPAKLGYSATDAAVPRAVVYRSRCPSNTDLPIRVRHGAARGTELPAENAERRSPGTQTAQLAGRWDGTSRSRDIGVSCPSRAKLKTRASTINENDQRRVLAEAARGHKGDAR